MTHSESLFQEAINHHQSGQTDYAMSKMLQGLKALSAEVEELKDNTEHAVSDLSTIRTRTAAICDHLGIQ